MLSFFIIEINIIELGRALSHNAQILQGLHLSQADPASWVLHARPLLQSHREWLQLDWLDSRLRLVASETSPWHARLDPPGRSLAAEAQAACVTAERLNGPAYAPSLFMPQHDGGAGHEVMPLCVPVDRGYVMAAYSLSAMLMLPFVGYEAQYSSRCARPSRCISFHQRSSAASRSLSAIRVSKAWATAPSRWALLPQT